MDFTGAKSVISWSVASRPASRFILKRRLTGGSVERSLRVFGIIHP